VKIKLVKIGKNKIQVIKLIRLFSGLGLKESKEIADKVPSGFEVYKAEYDFEQVRTNFEAIGAKISIVEEPEKKGPKQAAEDSSTKELKPAKNLKTNKPKIKKKKVYEKPKFSGKPKTGSFIKSKELSLGEKLDNRMFVKSIKSSLIIAFVGSAVSAFIFLYYNLSLFLLFPIIGIIIALTIRKITGRANRNLGILAAAFTLFSYIIYPFFSNLAYAVLNQDIYYFHTPSILYSYVSIFNPTAIIAAAIAFFIASNAKIDELLSNVFKNRRAPTKFSSKTYKKGKRNIRRKKRKLD